MHDHRRLRVWEDSIKLAVVVYRMTADFPEDERFGLTAQIRRAATSISSDTAEGAGRGRPKEMAQYLRVALGSISELESQIELAVRLQYPENNVASALGTRAHWADESSDFTTESPEQGRSPSTQYQVLSTPPV